MANGFSTDVTVKRRERDGWFVYTSDELPGLFVACKNDQTAYDDVTASIRCLMKLDFGIDCVVTHRVTYADFVSKIRLSQLARRAVAERTDEMIDGFTRMHFAVHPKTADPAHA